MTAEILTGEDRTRPYSDAHGKVRRLALPEPESPASSDITATTVVDWPRTHYPIEQALDYARATPFLKDAPWQVRTHATQRLREALAALATVEGSSWQERWVNSGLEQSDAPFETLIALKDRAVRRRYEVRLAITGLTWAFAADLIRPSYEFLFRQVSAMRKAAPFVLDTRDPEGFAAIQAAIDRRSKNPERVRKAALPQLARIMMHTGAASIGDIDIADVEQAYTIGARILPVPPAGATYDALTWAQFMPEDGAARVWGHQTRVGQLSVEQLVDRTQIAPGRVRDLLVLYLRARSTSIDYSTLTGLVTTLAKNFWALVQQIDPGVDTLRLAPQVVVEWKERVRYIQPGHGRAGQKRVNIGSIYTAVRAFYWDISDWAHQSPERFAEYAAPNIISNDDMRLLANEASRQRARSHARTRERLPFLEALVESVETQRAWYAEALAAVAPLNLGESFTVQGVRCTRTTRMSGKVEQGRRPHATGSRTFITRHDTGQVFDARHLEDITFWQWAIVGILKETGMRIEELEELSHTSLSQYRLPSTGELLPLLQIAPSKFDRERVMLISPDLADVLTDVLERVRDKDGRVPTFERWDSNERLTLPPMPLLMQRDVNGRRSSIKRGWVMDQLLLATTAAGLLGTDGEPLVFQPHDFRRLFLTDIVATGLPIHIASKLAGHRSVDTTEGYTAVYPEEVFTAHRLYIERRRAARPESEYREPTDEEWDEFHADFDKRELELGSCGRAFGTPCVHEHACLRCPMLRVNPARKDRLIRKKASIEKDLITAQRQGWVGEIGILQITLAGAEQKLKQMESAAVKPSSVSLGMPALRTSV